MKLKLFVIFLIALTVVYFALDNEKDKKIEEYLQKHSDEYSMLYDMNYHQFKDKSSIIFESLINTASVIDIYKKLQDADETQKASLRGELHNLLKDKYNRLKSTKLRQLHFNLSNNESFLRFHKPNKFGDNLTGVRETIEYVNKHQRAVDSFEEGRIYSGYRFVYPLRDKEQNHLGSVEISFNMSIFTSEFMQHFNVLSNFHIKKSVVDRKVWEISKSSFNLKGPFEDYYMENSVLKELFKHTNVKPEKLRPNLNTLNKMRKAIALNKIITLYADDLGKVITIIPVKNKISDENVAFITVRGDGSYIGDTIKQFYLILLMVTLFLIIIFTLLYKKLMIQEVANNQLQKRVKEEVEKNRVKDRELLNQAKMVSLGEMIGNIAHQWRQPLGVISVNASNVKITSEMGTLDDDFMIEKMDVILKTTQYLSETIDTFRNFIKENKEINSIVIQDKIDTTLNILSSTLSENFIEIKKDIDYDTPLNITLAKGELSQVIINIINNAKDVLIFNDVKDKWIKISLKKRDLNAILTIEDSGGGVAEDIIDKIFEPYFTTKHKSQGTGLGLSMSYKMITENLLGKLYIKNTQNGAKFYIEVPLDKS